MTPKEAYTRAYHLMRKQRHYERLQRAYDNPMHTQMKEMFTDALRNIQRELHSMPRRPVMAAYRITAERDPRTIKNVLGSWQIDSFNPMRRFNRYSDQLGRLDWVSGKLQRAPLQAVSHPHPTLPPLCSG